MCIPCALNDNHPSLNPSPSNIVQLIDFTYSHDGFPTTPTRRKVNKFNPFIQTLVTKGWKVNPLVTITIGVRGAMCEPSMQALKNLNISPQEIEKLMKYLIYVVLNKTKFNNKQALVDPP
jgi:hypothetical protein